MPGDKSKPLLRFDDSTSGTRAKGHPPKIPQPEAYQRTRQRRRFGPKFERLQGVIRSGGDPTRLREEPDALAPETLVVFETKGPLLNFAKACDAINLRIIADDDAEVIDDEEMAVEGHYYLTIPDQAALNELLRLWTLWNEGRSLGKNNAWAQVFACLHDLRRWGPRDRVSTEDATLIAEDATADPQAPVRIEIELAFTPDEGRATEHRSHVIAAVTAVSGAVRTSARITEIAYDALLVDVPASAAHAIVNRDSLGLAGQVDVYAIRPQSAITVRSELETDPLELPAPSEGVAEPIVAILDAVPQQNHPLLQGRLDAEDPFQLEPLAIGPRVHGTAMASLIIHGDLLRNEQPIKRRIAFRPIMFSAVNDPNFVDEAPPANRLVVDLLVQAVRQLKEPGQSAFAPTVLIINLSIGDRKRPFFTRISALARAIDWLSAKYGILFLISAGNVERLSVSHVTREQFIATAGEQRTQTTLMGLHAEMRNRRLLSPAEAINGLTVGALHDDEVGADPDLGESRDPLPEGVLPSPLSRMGLGYRNSIKPDLLFAGGRLRALLEHGPTTAVLQLNGGNRFGGLSVAAPGSSANNRSSRGFCGATSGATALASRAAHLIHDALEDAYGTVFGELTATNRALILKALLVHRASIPTESRALVHSVFGPQGQHDGHKRKANVSRLFGHGIPDIDAVLGCVTERATLWGSGVVAEDETRIFKFPLPVSLAGHRGLRKLSVTLAWFTPVQPGRRAYRGVRLKVEKPDFRQICTGSTPGQPGPRETARGTLYQASWEGKAVKDFAEGAFVHIRVARDPDQADELPDVVPFGLAATLECEGEGLPVYEQVKERLAIKPTVPTPIAVAVGG